MAPTTSDSPHHGTARPLTPPAVPFFCPGGGLLIIFLYFCRLGHVFPYGIQLHRHKNTTHNGNHRQERQQRQEANGSPHIRFRRHAGPGQHAGIRLHPRRGQEQQGVLERGQLAGREAGCRPRARLHGPHDTGGAEQGPLAAARGVPGVGPQHTLLCGRRGVVHAHEPLCRRARAAAAALHQLVGPARDHRGHVHCPRVQAHIRLLVPLQRRRHSLLARRGGKLHKQDAVRRQDKQGCRVPSRSSV